MSLSSIERSVREAERTDYKMPVWLPFIPILFIIIGLMAMFAGRMAGMTAGIGTAMAFFLLGVLVNLYVLYKWIWRRNEHFRRTLLLYNSIADYIESKGYKEGAVRLRDEARRMEIYQGGEKGAVLWTILGSIVPFVIYYVYHFLNKDFVHHDREERIILEQIDRLLKDAGLEGLDLGFTSVGRFPERSTILYFILSLITLNIFTLYWVYVLTKDPNEHFDAHRILEQKILERLENLPQASTEE